ncbi:SPW repeat protein [Asanoa sp. WMMD1127]|uniref:SPW repeat protein n=1 Tax=Asanoa sp. WMMD1127 TaxID=3016107 RepID=UPI0024170DD9|nr:SPW repeat protein [Asanoa sp. WMMD1127]MDG4826320.1 SPW repeat protein [Asanoa sp. WMMD1127]
MSNPRRSRPDDPVRDGVTDRNGTSGNGMPMNGTTRNGMPGNGMAGNGMTGRHAAEPMATQGGQRMESRSYADDGGTTAAADAGYAPTARAADPDRVQQSAISAPNALLLIAGVWLIISRFVFDYPLAGSTAGGVLNGVVIGIFVALLALVRMSAYRSNPMINLVTVVAGGWMMASPWAFGYAHFGNNGRPGWSDIIVGGAIILFGLLGFAGQAVRRPRFSGGRMGMMNRRGGGRLATR